MERPEKKILPRRINKNYPGKHVLTQQLILLSHLFFHVNGTTEIGVTLANTPEGINQCQEICRWIEDCENFSWKEGQCRLIKSGEAANHNENIHQLVRVSYEIDSIYGRYDCFENCACATRACNEDRTFSIDRYNAVGGVMNG